MSGHRFLYDEGNAYWVRGNLAASAVGPTSSSGMHRLVIAASTAETNTIPDPTGPGFLLILIATTVGSGGTRAVTFSTRFDAAGDVTVTFGTVRQYGFWISVPDASTTSGFRWELVSTDAAITNIVDTARQVKRLTTQYDIATSTVLADPGLALNVKAGQKYKFRAHLISAVGATGGIKVSIGGTATATSIGFVTTIFSQTSSNIAASAQETALAGAVSYNTDTALSVVMEGVIVVNAAGTLFPSFAQKTSDGTNSSVLVGSSFEIDPTTN